MSVLTDLIYGGSNAVAGLTEGAVNDAIAKYGADKEIAVPDTACTCTGELAAIPAAIFWCIILVPWQLAGAGMLLPIVMMIAFRKDKA